MKKGFASVCFAMYKQNFYLYFPKRLNYGFYASPVFVSRIYSGGMSNDNGTEMHSESDV